ncbi:MAG: hypothetical protein IAE85_16010 [Anaerolinea sp.]|nr:hypothetical protein [Anaerolinea sp.]
MQTVTLELPERLYQNVQRLARASHKSLESFLETSIAQTLPPLDDVPADEAIVLAKLAHLDDAALWREARRMLTVEQQHSLEDLLYRQSAGNLTARQEVTLEELMQLYGQLTLRKAHAYLLLARRGYRVPMQEDLQ